MASTARKPTASAPAKAAKATKPASARSAKWSQDVSAHSDALDLEPGVFKQRSARRIAESLKASAEHSGRRKGEPFQSAMSMLNFYINRAGDTLSSAQRTRLENAKHALRKLFDRPEPAAPAAAKTRRKTAAGN